MQHHKYSLTELENMYPFEREIYTSMLVKHLEEEKAKREQENLHKSLIENNMRGEGVKNPLVVFEDLDLWEDKV